MGQKNKQDKPKSVWDWLKDRWKVFVGAIVALFAIFMIMIRGKKQKEVLEAANKSHDAENKANDKARKDLVDGLDKISKDKDTLLDDINDEFDDDAKKLALEKEKFIEDSKDSDTLVDDLADHLDADIVEADDE